MLESLPWVLIVQIWMNDPPKIIPIITQQYPNYHSCMQARSQWDRSPYTALCGVKSN